MNIIKNITVSKDGASIRYQMEAGPDIVLSTKISFDIGTFDPLGHIVAGLAVALLDANLRIDALEKKIAT